MDDFILYISTAFALLLVIEGLLYTIFPDGMRKLMIMAITMPTGQMRNYGLVMVGSGAFLVWLLQYL